MIVAMYTAVIGEIVSGTIRFAQAWNRSHALLAFTESFTEAGGFKGDYFESINKVDRITGKTGVRGPVPLENLWEWQAEDPDNHLITLQPMPWFTEKEIEQTRKRLDAACLLITYPKITVQLWGNFKMLMSGYKFGIPPKQRSINRWDCSETIPRVLPEWFAMEACNLGDWLYEEYVPGTTRGEDPAFGPGLYQMIEAYKSSTLVRKYLDGSTPAIRIRHGNKDA
jgi:hypothetical protein